MMGLLKNMVQLKKPEPLEPQSEARVKEERRTYHEDGAQTSALCNGNPENLKASFGAIYYRFENKCKLELHEQELLKQPYHNELKAKKTLLLTKTEDLKREQDKLEHITSQIGALEDKIVDVQRDPQKYGIPVSKRSSTKFWIGLVLLLFLMVYIFIFYVSTSYSAFFRTFDPSTDLFGGMFYPDALKDAWNASFLEFGFVIFIPSVFFGLGYLVHMFWHKKSPINYIKVALLMLTTFVFDALLAYLIDKKLYDLNRTFEDPSFDMGIAFQSPSFWIIIFAGFVSYLILGLVFDMVMKEHTDRDKIQNFILTLRKDIENLRKSAAVKKEVIASIEKTLADLRVRMAELENIIDGFILPIRNYKALATEYLQGWLETISSKIVLTKELNDEYLATCTKIFNDHIQELDLNTHTYQNKVYTKTV